ncbi:hypothetical protein Cgig2_027565 [Carnegiea gigantea]|uniref:Non-haem dioxygenase N-terminal domain-containing protein n=1 Tax=Carnegiea gigantea TaxID=171969 RepID=A0A9Q1Q8D2_9CARY|nr:hypothetical protein Cgig2_027565 [Carnegiea gigantea]
MSRERTMIIDLKAFDESKTGVKGLLHAGAEKIPSIFVRSQEDLSKEFDTYQEDLAIPIVDLTNVRQTDIQGEEIIRRIIWASEKWGFFQLVNHGIPLEVLDKVIEGVRMFHEQDVDLKKEYYSRDHTKQIGGLQVLHQNQWVNVKPVPGALIVNIGDFLQVSSTTWSRMTSFEEYITEFIAKKVGPRISIAAFSTGPVSSTKIYGPIKELVSKDNPPIYKEFTRQEFLEQFFTRAFDQLIIQYFRQTT